MSLVTRLLPLSRIRHVRPLVDDRIGPWKLDGCLGSGEFARVFLARPIALPDEAPADYVLKVGRGRNDLREQANRLLKHEVAVARQVNHPNVISVLSAGQDAGVCYFVSPYLPGASLQTLLQRHRLSPPHALWIARQTAAALGALHAAGWRHGDVKPSNVHVAASGHVTLIDLAFARSLDSQPDNHEFCGTCQYAAPENFGSLLPLGAAADVYSLGIMLFEMLTGHVPFRRATAAALADAHTYEPLPEIDDNRDGGVTVLNTLLQQMTAKQPEARIGIEQLIDRIAALEIDTFAKRFQ